MVSKSNAPSQSSHPAPILNEPCPKEPCPFLPENNKRIAWIIGLSDIQPLRTPAQRISQNKHSNMALYQFGGIHRLEELYKNELSMTYQRSKTSTTVQNTMTHDHDNDAIADE
jgi:hypothetical protein